MGHEGGRELGVGARCGRLRSRAGAQHAGPRLSAAGGGGGVGVGGAAGGGRGGVRLQVGAVRRQRVASPSAAPPRAPRPAVAGRRTCLPQPSLSRAPSLPLAFLLESEEQLEKSALSPCPLPPWHHPAFPPLAASDLCLPSFSKFSNFQPQEPICPTLGDSEQKVSSNPRKWPQGRVSS